MTEDWRKGEPESDKRDKEEADIFRISRMQIRVCDTERNREGGRERRNKRLGERGEIGTLHRS